MEAQLQVRQPTSHRSTRRMREKILLYILMVVVVFLVCVPIIWLLITSLKKDVEYLSYPIKFLPAVPQWSNYTNVFDPRYDFLKHAGISAGLALGSSILTVISSSLAGFAFARFPEVKARDKLFAIVASMIIIPQIVTVIPQFIIFSRLHLTGTYWPWVLWGIAGSPILIFLFRQFFIRFPRELEDAAEIDGCSTFEIFWRIFLPNAKPVIATAFILNFVAVWGDWFAPLIYLNSENTTLSVVISTAYVNPQGQPLTTLTLAAVVLYILPMVVIFFFGQRYIMQGTLTSGLTGR